MPTIPYWALMPTIRITALSRAKASSVNPSVGVSFQSDQALDSWQVRVDSTTSSNGTLVASGSSLAANTNQNATVNVDTLSLVEGPHTVRAWGTIGGTAYGDTEPRKYGVITSVTTSDTSANFATMYAAGIRYVVLSAYWSRYQTNSTDVLTSSGEWTALKQRIIDANSAGLKVGLNVSVHYPSSYAASGVEKYKNQNAEEHSGSNGTAVRNWVWTQTGRVHVENFVGQLIRAIRDDGSLGLSTIDNVRIGGGQYGEVGYPLQSGYTPTISYWAYGAAQQTGADLAAGMVVCPLPGYVPFAGPSQSAANDQTWIDWYLDGINKWIGWLAEIHRKNGWTGDIYVMHPSFGIRSDWTAISTPASRPTAYREEMAFGIDPLRQITAYGNMPNVWPYSTWASADHNVSPPTADSEKAPWLKIYDSAATVGKQYGTWGENSDSLDTHAIMDRIFNDADQAIATGYQGVVWFHFESLADAGTEPTMAYYATNIASKP